MTDRPSDAARPAAHARPLLRMALAALLLTTLGCPPPRIDYGVRGKLDDPAEVMQEVLAAQARVVRLDAEARLKVVSPDGRGSMSVFVAVDRPHHLHFEPLDFFGRPMAVLVANGERFGLYLPDEARYHTGPPTPENVSRLFPVLMTAEELATVLLGAAPLIRFETVDMVLSEESRAYVLTLQRGVVVQKLWVDPATFRVKRSEIHGAPGYDLEFDDFQTHGQVTFPREIVLEVPRAKTEATLSYGDVNLNAPADPSLFTFEAPEGVATVEVDAEGRVAGTGEKVELPKLAPAPAPPTGGDGGTEQAPSP